MRIGFDVDGVLADFNTSFIERVVRLTDRDLFPPRPFDIPCWDYPEHYGYTKEETSRVWRDIKADPTFWLTLKPYDEGPAVIQRLRELKYAHHDIYFITSRPGVDAKLQTETWLANHGGDFLDVCTVLISSEKGLCARALDLNVYIDDRDLNVVDVATSRQEKTITFLLNRPWNTSWGAFETGLQVHRVSSATEMLTELGLW